MSDLRWSECDEIAHLDPIRCLLCRTSKLNDHAHTTDVRLGNIETHITRWGILTALGAFVGVGFQIWRAVHGG